MSYSPSNPPAKPQITPRRGTPPHDVEAASLPPTPRRPPQPPKTSRPSYRSLLHCTPQGDYLWSFSSVSAAHDCPLLHRMETQAALVSDLVPPSWRGAARGAEVLGDGRDASAALLIAADALVRLQATSADEDGWTLLHHAIVGARTLLLRRLLNAGCSPELRLADGHWRAFAPLHVAAMAGQLEATNLLLNAGADIDARDEDGRTALHIAAMTGHANVLALLCARGADLDLMDETNDRCTALHFSLYSGTPLIGQTLLAWGASDAPGAAVERPSVLAEMIEDEAMGPPARLAFRRHKAVSRVQALFRGRRMRRNSLPTSSGSVISLPAASEVSDDSQVETADETADETATDDEEASFGLSLVSVSDRGHISGFEETRATLRDAFSGSLLSLASTSSTAVSDAPLLPVKKSQKPPLLPSTPSTYWDQFEAIEARRRSSTVSASILVPMVVRRPLKMDKSSQRGDRSARQARLDKISVDTAEHCARLGVELFGGLSDAVEQAQSVLIEWELVQDMEKSVLETVWFDCGTRLDMTRQQPAAGLSRETLASWDVLQGCMVASMTCKLDIDRNKMSTTGPQGDMALLARLDEVDVNEKFARYEILDQFGQQRSFCRYTVVRDTIKGTFHCIVRGPPHEVNVKLMNGIVSDGKIIDRMPLGQGRLRMLRKEMISATKDHGKHVVVYGLLDLATTELDDEIEMPSRAALRASTDFALAGVTCTGNEVGEASMRAIHKLRNRQVSIIFTSSVIDPRTLKGAARAIFGLDVEDWTASESPPLDKGAQAIVCCAPRIVRAIKSDLNLYERLARAQYIFAPACGRQIRSLIQAAASIDDYFFCLASPELLAHCDKAAFRVSARSTTHVDGPLLPYQHNALAMRREALIFADPRDTERACSVTFADGVPAGTAKQRKEVAVDADAHIDDSRDPLVAFAAFLRFRQRSRHQGGQLAYDLDPTPGARIAWVLSVFWFLPIAIVALWMMFPLSLSGGEEQDFWGFAIYHTGYQVEAMLFGVLLFGTTLPIPPARSITFILFVTAALNVAYLTFVRVATDTQLTPVNVAPSTFPIAIAFFSWYLHFLHSSYRIAHTPQRYVREKDERSNAAITFMIRNVVASKQDRDVFSGVRLPVYMAEYLLYIVIAAAILTIYYYCQLFTAFYETVESESLKVAFAFLYGIPLTLIGNVMITAADKIEARAIRGHRQGTLGVLVVCIIELFHQIFYKGLFTQVTVLETFLALQAVAAVVQFVMFPVRMSRAFYTLRTAFFRRFDPPSHLLSSMLGEVGGADVTIETYRHDLTVEFCAVSMAQRIAGTMFLVGLFLVRNTPNGEFLTLSALSEAEYDQLVMFTVLMLGIEWLVSLAIHFIIRVWHKFDAVLVGGSAISKSRGLWTLVAVTVHILIDYFVAINRMDQMRL